MNCNRNAKLLGGTVQHHDAVQEQPPIDAAGDRRDNLFRLDVAAQCRELPVHIDMRGPFVIGRVHFRIEGTRLGGVDGDPLDTLVAGPATIKQMRDLEGAGGVHPKMYHELPPRVEYSFSDQGRELEPTLQALCGWRSSHRVWLGLR